MIEINELPALNCFLNATAATLLVSGFICIRLLRNVAAHKACMLGAAFSSALFLISYICYHAVHGATHFQGRGALRVVYFTILISHTILAVVNVPLVIITLTHALRRRIAKHRRIARVTLPVWLYVSVTGILVYLMLYVWT